MVRGRNDDKRCVLYHVKKRAIIAPGLHASPSSTAAASSPPSLRRSLILHDTMRQMSRSDNALSTHISVNLFLRAGDSSFLPKSPPGFMVASSLKLL